jgi:TRAP transporter TAXI family solute receptor
MSKKSALFATIVICVLAMLVSPVYAAKARVTWTAGGTGGGWFVMAGGIAKIVQEKNSNIQINVIPGGGTKNQPVVGSNKAELGWALPPFVVLARKGADLYKGKKYEDIVVLGGGFSQNYLHVMAAQDTGVKTMSELRDYPKPIRVSPGKIGVSGEFTYRKMLEEYFKTSYDEIKKKGGKVIFTGYTGIATNLKDRHLDFACINIAPPAAIIQEASLGRKLNIVSWPDDLLQLMKTKYGYGIGVIKKEMYPGILAEDVPTATMGTVLMAHKSLDPEVAYQIIKIISENKDRLPAIHKSLGFDPKVGWKDLPGPLHPGAERYYKDS